MWNEPESLLAGFSFIKQMVLPVSILLVVDDKEYSYNSLVSGEYVYKFTPYSQILHLLIHLHAELLDLVPSRGVQGLQRQGELYSSHLHRVI